MDTGIMILVGVIGLVLGAVIGGFVLWRTMLPRTEEAYRKAEKEVDQQREEAAQEAQKITHRAQEEVKQLRLEAEKVIERRYQDLSRTEERIDRRQETQDRQQKKLEVREQALSRRQSRLDRRLNELKDVETQRMEELERIASMTQDEARQVLLVAVEGEARQDMARIMREIEDQAREAAEERARKLISLAIQRVASDHVSEIAVSVVPLPGDEMKGRIIGRNGRNIRAFEQAAGVDVIVDDTPEAVTISSFDSVRREIARRALSKLVTDGRIHPARIEKVIKDAKVDVEKTIREAGEQAA